jgi:hypothetical protein
MAWRSEVRLFGSEEWTKSQIDRAALACVARSGQNLLYFREPADASFAMT